MEKSLAEIMKELSDEELLRRYINKGGKLGIEAAKEILGRNREGRMIPKKCLIAILENVKPKGMFQQEEVAKIKKETVKRLIKGLLDEDDLLVILGAMESHKIKEEVTGKFLRENNQITNPTLREIIRQIPSLGEEAARRILKQKPNRQDYLVIVEELNGELQIRVLNKLLQKGMSQEDACWLMEFLPPPLPEIIWGELDQKGKIKKLSLDQLEGIFRRTDSLKVREETRKEALKKVNEEEEELKEKAEKEPGNMKLQWRLGELDELKRKFEQSPQKEEKMAISSAQQT